MSPLSLSIFFIISLGKEIPTAIEDCITIVLLRFINRLAYSSESKIINMSKTSNSGRYQNLYRSPSQLNGLKYDIDIDRAIINQLAESESLSSGKLKERIEMVLTRAINDKTYFNHLRKLVDKKILNKQDDGKRGKVSVYYSLTEEAKRRNTAKAFKRNRCRS
jgi:predicted HTH transcriptional regulator